MKKKIFAALLGLAISIATMVQPAYAAEDSFTVPPLDDKTAMAISVLYDAYKTGTNITVKFEVKKADAAATYSQLKRYLDGITPGAQPKTIGTVLTNNGVQDGDMTELKVQFYATNEVNTLQEDPRVVNETKTLNGLTSFEDKINEICRFVGQSAVYDTELAQSGKVPLGHSSTTALGCLNGKAVCQGYTNLASYFFEEQEIENVSVRCNVNDTLHIFNMARDAAGNMYVVDATFARNGWSSCLISLDQYIEMFNATIVIDPNTLFTLKYGK